MSFSVPNPIYGEWQNLVQHSLWLWSVENPKGALDIFLKSAPTTNRKVAEAIWRLTVEHLLTPESKKLGIGHMTREKWERTLAIVKQTSKETINVKAADLYTNEFLPKLFPKAP